MIDLTPATLGSSIGIVHRCFVTALDELVPDSLIEGARLEAEEILESHKGDHRKARLALLCLLLAFERAVAAGEVDTP